MSERKTEENSKEAAGGRPAWAAVHIVGIALCAALFETFFVLSLLPFRGDWSEALWLLAIIGGTLLNAAVLSVDLVFYFLGKEVVYKLCITVYVCGIFFALCFYILIETGFLEVLRDEGSFENYLQRAGSYMTALFISLQFLQVVVLPIPSTVTVAAGTALFGPLRGSLYSLAGIVLGSLVAFLIGRYAGLRVAYWLVGRETLDKWMKKIKGKDKLLLTAMFLLPVFPDDVLCFVAGFSSMSVWYFLAVIVISRVLAIFTTSYLVALIPFNTWWGILIWIVLIVLVGILFVVLYKKSDAILGWFEKKFHRETRIKEKKKEHEFTVEVVSPDGAIVQKGVKRSGEDVPKQD